MNVNVRLGLRGRIFVLTVLLIVVVCLAAGIYLERRLRTELEARTEQDLTHHVLTARALVEMTPSDQLEPEADAIADRLGRSTSARVTIVSGEGVVLGDSSVPEDSIEGLDNHLDRPELQTAGVDQVGVSRRYSDTLGTQMLYVASAYEAAEGHTGYVRVAMPLSEVDAQLRRQRGLIALAGALALVVALFAGTLLSFFVARILGSLIASARLLAESGGTGRLPVESTDELGRIATSFNRLAAELEHSMAALADERDRFETVLESMDEAVLSLDAEARITTLNRAARTLLGLPESAEGERFTSLVRVSDVHQLIKNAQQGEPGSVEFELTSTGNRSVLARATPQANEGVLLVMHDVTEVRRLETVRRDFVANVSHELRTPVSIIRANAETLLNGALERPDQARRFVEALLRHADRLGRLISDLLDISRIEAGKYPISPRPSRLAPIARRTLEVVETKATIKQMKLEVKIPDDLAVVADPKALEQVILNLVENAVKYTPEHGHVEVAAVVDGQITRIEVRDDGPGIDAVHRPRIFERFYRVDPGRSREMGGTGLGLAIVKHLVEAMRGRVGVEPRQPHGSVFWVALPTVEP